MFLLHAQDVMKFVAANRAWSDLKKSGQVEFVKNGEQAPEGFTRIQDSIKNAYFIKDGVRASNGEWWVEKGAARLIDNYTSNDWFRQGKAAPVGKALLDIKNATTATELLWPGFHAAFVTNDAIASILSHAVSTMTEKGFGAAAKSLLTAPIYPSEFRELNPLYKPEKGKETFTTSIRGQGKAVERFAQNPEEFKANYPKAYEWLKKQYPEFDQMVEEMFFGGMKIGMHDDYRVNAVKKFMEAVRNDKYIGTVVRSVPALNQKIMHPIFEDYIPRLKLGTMLREYALARESQAPEVQSGKKTNTQLARQTWAFVEDRFGQLNWDNLYWNRTFKSFMQLFFRSATWKLGTIRAYGKAGRDMGVFAADSYNLLSGKPGAKPRVTAPMGWAIGSLFVTAVQASVISKVFTGQYPWQLAKTAGDLAKELLFPRIDKDDETQRVSIPGYWKDLIAIRRHPIKYLSASMTGEIGRMVDVWNNRDFYGDQVYNEDDPKVKRWYDIAKHLVPVPFVYSSIHSSRESGEGIGRSSTSLMGYQKAPYYISHSEAELKAAEMLRDQLPVGGRTQEEEEKASKTRKAVMAVKRGEMTLDQAFDKGLLDWKRWREYEHITQDTHLQTQMRHLTPKRALKVYAVATPEEKKQIRGDIEDKIYNSKEDWDKKDEWLKQLGK